ncbi:MAG: tetratricopeptide repeat protein, partial [Deltaproteobacteria bacterium]|nr:tetratricopeptide repeat protein [Deltaproteobacteria bacterium]
MKNEPNFKKIIHSKHTPVIIVIIISFGVYYNALFNGFVYDDKLLILENPWITNIRYIPDILFSPVLSFSPKFVHHPQNYYRPMTHLIYMFDYHIFGLKPWGFHLTNIVFHVMNSLLVFLITSSLVKCNTAKLTAFIAALLFATHPIHTEAVTMVSNTPGVSFTFFYLLSFYLFIKSDAPSNRLHLLSLLSFFLAIFCKETALTLPLLLLIYDYSIRKNEIFTWSRVKIYLPYLLIVGFYVGLRVYALGGIAPREGVHGLTPFQNFINVFPLFSHYLYKLVLPLNLHVFYSFLPANSIFESKVITSIGVALAFCYLTYIAGKTKSKSFIGLLLIFIPLLPVLYIPGLSESVFNERFLYLPSVGFVILLSLGVIRIIKFSNRKHTIATLTIITVLILTSYSLATIKRNQDWFSGYTLWTDTIKKAPNSAVAHNNLGNIYLESGLTDKAIKEYMEALRIKPAYEEATYNLATLYHQRGMLDEAIPLYERAIKLDPLYFSAHSNL